MVEPKVTKVFPVNSGEPLAPEHGAISTWIDDALQHLGEHSYYKDLDLKELPSGAALLAGDPEQSRRYLMAAVAQVIHWDRLAAEVRASGETEMQRINAHMLPGWGDVWGRRRKAEAVISALMRRNLPLTSGDLIAITDWCSAGQNLSSYFGPLGAITKALQRFAETNALDPELHAAATRFGIALRSSHDKNANRLGTAIEQLCPNTSQSVGTEPSSPALASPQPAPAGASLVMIQLKDHFDMITGKDERETFVLEPDIFPIQTQSPLLIEHDLLSTVLGEVVGKPGYHQPELEKLKSGPLLLTLPPAEMGRAILAAAERHVNALISSSVDYTQHAVWQSRYTVTSLCTLLANCNFEFDRDGAFDLLLYLSAIPVHQRDVIVKLGSSVLRTIRLEAAKSPLSEGERYVLSLYRAARISGPPLGVPSEEVILLTSLIQDGAMFVLTPGEAWSDAVNSQISNLPAERQKRWIELLRHALSATAARPSAKWIKSADALIQALGGKEVREAFAAWLPLVANGQTIRKIGSYAGDTRGGSDTMHVENANCLRGLLWCIPLLPQRDELVRTVTNVALSAYRKVPGVGPRAVKVGNAAVYALSELASKDAVGQLAMLKVRVKFGTAQKEIEKAFDAAAASLSLPRDQIEELGVPSYGLEEVGHLSETLGNYRAELQVTGSDARLSWFDATGKALKAVPAKVKSECKDELKELQQSLKDIQGMLPAQRDRIDGLFLSQKSWLFTEWFERYHNHPLVGTITQRLLWCVDGAPALFQSGVPTDERGVTIEHGKTAEVTLWHPVGRTVEEVISWRQRLETLAITQPFKQAHREVYLLTDAERNTRTYSNRYAAHVIRQHQFNALCAARGWKNRLRLMVDDSYLPPTKELPQWGLRAEYWVEGIGEGHGTDTNDSGVYLRLATDQVRFYRVGAADNYVHASGGQYQSHAQGPGAENINEPVPLEQVPALVFSEIMRDVDLFVGVSSVGNDPNWQDGGPEGRYREYWQSYAFGELSGTASTRKQVLERLIPRLKIAARCSFNDRFLVVRGDLRTYKIHLGSGNILMEPNDQYLCIVPDAKSRSSEDALYLPFEGDATLSIIISKALLLAADSKIKDQTIVQQIKIK
ncbi:hypothetical protein ETAA8_40490 [Anatilimnocola aggregata]|uniref:Uncharacterized protein n=1 Tax=Anatilimnocola aggregata TaxID=2528021 RepID=A0A517YFD9_9BACT|nr:hypothetical protein ETAA8_40490 [Anatilimnocola aggregata]